MTANTTATAGVMGATPGPRGVAEKACDADTSGFGSSHGVRFNPGGRESAAMVPSPRALLVGPPAHRRRYVALALAPALFAATFAAYAVGVFGVSGCVVFIPGQALLVGVAAAAAAGYVRVGLVAAWLGAYAPLLGFNAHHAFVGLSSRTRVEQLAYFLELDGLAFYAVVALVFGAAAFAAGYALRTGVAVLRGDRTVGDLGL